ncbi:MAG: tRNA lysidine(34) synthetase TilS [Candidatus Omnitrophica bacterium CG08_land_8_20_14_0_20_41_16]|uniref:tRNA(Ile)-lysidine synthase n=1 Tax=Candidatus Sherwoodlollariibacterium unditelluris TaxID=1974757 RepID=A0A2G9YKR1_9BACT|nr:MAG: tRNA lysidine(34) synthetase TilS [Candidatus Omnitrophica bacterium CG23_combo_of_CG06-09_8_20_14_all_41_10]PIS33567.1 MAG: tRNA lysidine(34) synthetase TilS [Candidatus Omnitrophica bacterium CG08_land_8_20_14_0_20_41_16]
MNIREKIKSAIKKYNLINKGERVVIGVSGGADSVCLLYLLSSLKKELGINLHIAHLDHMLRKESAKDAKFVKKLGERMKIPVTLGKINVKKIAKRGSLEEVARNERLAFLLKVADKIKAKRIALAHHFDDQVETVLMRILRGTGLSGLSGILPKRKMGKVDIVRPLLEVRRKDIENFLKRKRLSFCIDKSNTDEAYLRNRIRHNLLPLLEKEYNKNIREVLFNLAQNAGCDYDYLRVCAGRFFKTNKTKLNLSKLTKLHPSILRLKLRDAISNLQGDTHRITFKHIRELEDLIFNRPRGSIVDLPKGISALKKGKVIAFYLR